MSSYQEIMSYYEDELGISEPSPSAADDHVQTVLWGRMIYPIKAQLQALHDGFNTLMQGEPVLQAFWKAAGEEILRGCFAGVARINPRDLILWPEHAFLQQFIMENAEDQAQLRAFVSFVTGNPNPPPGGVVQISVGHTPQGDEAYPTASTCASQISVPHYSSYENLRDKLQLALKDDSLQRE